MMDFKLTVELTASEPLLEAIRMLARVTPESVLENKPESKTEETTAPEAADAPKLNALTNPPGEKPSIEITYEAPVEAPVEAPAAATATAQEVRDAMQKIRNKFEYGTPEPGEEKGPNPDRDPVVKKKLTALFKELASELEAGVLPSELSKENKAIFIQRIAGTTLIDGAYVAPF